MPSATTRRALGSLWFPLVVLLVGIAATAFVTRELSATIEAQDSERFDTAVDELEDSVRNRIDTYIAMLRAAAGLLAAEPAIDAPAFRAFITRLELPTRYPGIQGLGYTARLAQADVPRVTAEQQRWYPDFRVWPESPRGEYHSILHLEPLDRRNLAALGYDMFSEPTRRAAMERARDTGEPAASGVVTLVQEIDQRKQPGFLIYLPVYDGAAVPPTVEQRRMRLLGFVYSPFRAGDLFAGILGRGRRPRAGLELFDGAPSPETLLHQTSPDSEDARFTTVRTIDVAGRRWTVRAFSLDALNDSSSLEFVPLVTWGGRITAILLAALALMQTRARVRAEESEAAAAAASESLKAHAEQLDAANRTVQQLLEREREARADAERVSRLKDEFLATLSHELRTPLNALIGWAHMLSTGRLADDKRQTAVSAILRNARAQSHLVDDLLDMSRILSGRFHLDMKELDVGDVVTAAIEVVRPIADAKGVTLAVSAAPGARILGDANRLQQVFWNLLSNAVKFTASKGRVDVRVEPRGEQVEISVADNGIGIDAGFLPHAFERFRQADSSFTRDQGGLGLGLSIVKSLVEMHAGTVRATSGGHGLGSTFTVTFPQLSGAGAAAIAAVPKSSAVLENGDALRGLTVLLVEDDDDARELAGEVLAQHGAVVRAAASGDQALRLLQGDGPPVDLLVSDLGMPGMDGVELIRRIRALSVGAGSTVPAIALTAFAGAPDQRRSLGAGFDLHVAKPFTPNDLVAACLMLVRERRPRVFEEHAPHDPPRR